MIKTNCAKFRRLNHPNNTLLPTWAAFLSQKHLKMHDLDTSTYQRVQCILNTDIRHIVGLLSARVDIRSIHIKSPISQSVSSPPSDPPSTSSAAPLDCAPSLTPHNYEVRLYAWYKLRLCHEKLEHVLWSVPFS